MLIQSTRPILVTLVATFPALCLAKGNDSIQRYLEQSFSAAIVMTDSEVLTFGVHDFDPNDWFNLSNDKIGSEESIRLRQQIAVSTLPFTFELSDSEAVNKHRVVTRLSVLASAQDVEVRQGDEQDYQEQFILGAFSAYRYQYKLDESWTVTPGLGVHLQYFKNNHDYKSQYSQALKPKLDGVVFNTDAWAVAAEPHIELKYDSAEKWGSWNATSAAHYFYGYGWGEANYGDVGNPEGWYLASGVEAFYDITHWKESVQSVYASFRRIDVGGDTETPMGTNHYYETSFGWLMTPPFKSDWIDNVGIGLNFNYGSALMGGSIVLFFNQE
ncbi:Solitary outer membrane autotransporter beta-barrel domain [Vibrio sp. TRT 17S01]|uniref:Solitary outer membrane autotransporter beta-barrel domain n=1 Tax=Vibrio sp. TRT 17S01 TaxID=3418505 RepID=UPI003CE9C74C